MKYLNQIALGFVITFLLTTCTARAQGTAFNCQGEVIDNDTNFTSLGQFKFAVVRDMEAGGMTVSWRQRTGDHGTRGVISPSV